MVYYFSATENSQHIAKMLAERLHLETTEIHKTTRPLAGSIYLVFPVYFTKMPYLIRSFVLGISFEKVTVILTCALAAGAIDHQIRRLIEARELVIYKVLMPSNYIVLREVDRPDTVRAKIEAAEKQVDDIVAGTAAPYATPSFFRIADPVFEMLYSRYAKTSPFQVSAACDACGVCAKSCPDRAISMLDGRPVWTSPSCNHCLRCVHHCHVQAIDYGKYTKGKARYVFK